MLAFYSEWEQIWMFSLKFSAVFSIKSSAFSDASGWQEPGILAVQQ
jgi:hypothetical protein